MSKGFAFIPVIIFILIASLASVAVVHYQVQPSKERAETASSSPSVGSQSQASSTASNAESNNTLPHIQSQTPQPESLVRETDTPSNIQQQFRTLEGELRNAQEKKLLLNCERNPSPVFTNDITDISMVNYIGPPPTMGAGPSLKTHSYIGTDHARVPVYAPTAMTLESGSHYVGGPYMVEFRVSCEVRVRFGHMTEPVEAIKKLLPAEPKLDSRTEELVPVIFAAGDIIGYTTGTDVAGNWDFGVYNSTVRNRYADDADWSNSATYTTAVCPFDYFPASLKASYVLKFNSAALGGNPPHGEPFCKGI